VELLAQGAAAPPPVLTPVQVTGFVLLNLVIILVAARAMGTLAQKIGQPRVVGEIVAGVLLGPTLLGPKSLVWENAPSWLNCTESLRAAPAGTLPSITQCVFPAQSRSVLGVLGQLALVLFMFLVGLELNARSLRGKEKGIGLLSVGAIAVPVALGFLIGPLLFTERFIGAAEPSQLSFTLFVGAMLAVTAFPVMARILQEKGLQTSPMGAMGIAAAAVVTILMFLLVAVASGVATGDSGSELTLKVLYALAYVAVMLLVVPRILAPVGRRYESAGALLPGHFATFFIVLFASAFVAHRLGINVIVGGFLAGIAMPAKERLFKDMSVRLADITAIVLLPVFLAFSGLATDFTALQGGDVPLLARFVVAGIVGKWAGGAVFARAGGLTWAEGNVLGILMNCRGLLVLVVALVGFQAGVISGPMQIGGVLMALVTTIMTGPLFDRFLPKAIASSSGGAPESAIDLTAAQTTEEQLPLPAQTTAEADRAPVTLPPA
jgi:Kef-type K+ transport system membrane component KefB